MVDKPLECTHCTRAISVTYKELGKDACISMGMCSNCPILEKKLHGQSCADSKMESTPILCCSKCLTTLESLQTGGDLGCDQCYAVFDQALIEKLVQEKKIPPINGEEFSRDSIHQGKSPHRSHAISPIHQMAVLDEALHEALQKEQYEQAAWLRDQIKTWKEKISESA